MNCRASVDETQQVFSEPYIVVDGGVIFSAFFFHLNLLFVPKSSGLASVDDVHYFLKIIA